MVPAGPEARAACFVEAVATEGRKSAMGEIKDTTFRVGPDDHKEFIAVGHGGAGEERPSTARLGSWCGLAPA